MRYFLSALGTANYTEALYCLDGTDCRTRFAPAAIANLTHLEGATGLILLTPEARKRNWPELERELRDSNVTCKPVNVLERLTQTDIFELLDTLTAQVPANSSVFLDITLGLRHLPVVYYAALVFAAGLKDVSVEKIYYAPWELRQDERVEIFDITLTFRLLEWFHALTSFRDSGDGRPLSRMLNSDVSQLFRAGQGDVILGKARDAVSKLTEYLAAGLPLQAGFYASRLNAAFSDLVKTNTGEIPSRLATEVIDGATNQISLTASKPTSAALDERELARELKLAEWYADRGDLGKCFAILREWMVNARLFTSKKAASWLSRRDRDDAERFFNNLRQRNQELLLDEPQQRVNSLWDEISQRRNFLQHCGMNDQLASPNARQARGCLNRADELMRSGFEGFSFSSGRGQLLLSTLGNSPGTIYTAIKLIKPDNLMIVSSSTAVVRLAEALQEGGWTGREPIVRLVNDPFGGFNEASSLMDREVLAAFVSSGEIIANLTGATTAMQWVVEGMTRRAELLGFAVRRIALIDRRSPLEQQRTPFVSGEVVYLDQIDTPTREN